ncbi:hypothetical protein LX32DRAFT_277995 [Colletotrichum zoysiae]|uniref:Uncharacterized protein n=1 Tax=Colletotrichum zoysiae TaxID=1216348 RepID=A0AAD9H3E1_9PEZI|nr:hypothetical protein LX32DRAFT_277995 [Colletotrichum zoysiae]
MGHPGPSSSVGVNLPQGGVVSKLPSSSVSLCFRLFICSFPDSNFFSFSPSGKPAMVQRIGSPHPGPRSFLSLSLSLVEPVAQPSPGTTASFHLYTLTIFYRLLRTQREHFICVVLLCLPCFGLAWVSSPDPSAFDEPGRTGISCTASQPTMRETHRAGCQ